ncbi:MAG: hypothetical protein A2898_04320 [Candidatus Kerfeldbacteria bacterium RIFCSPLOWO2_01_FULL_48_11]|uniref:Uncharacterized protein n=1 Tax=Candidatus Kerfeldbacteria bacterium RIFCSPLOWO2_01_FULL_48_11 TaxID=1798543 RepID=A0A1G2B0R5_9BACT|nr:MAG: hypothetical protein UY34_C0001G0068 [Parcubacteria group bacterium GW2011_GWA2_48_9]KKW16211.1 MAG: hypothetical protein UY52_C0008G0004 [Parcubacteria group bacterium GW2011_GWC2_49_9]OGY82791.1 MAG: hypothetical protein A2898_04320 [Candidatus Kerfeldbacteria bacterium RIFCSPLOWO2_01_FULL_48_11]HCJ52658.1 hypothetical protein [Candidatus Kerfeldbacteria bacterium]HCM68039.1 hypothetical protein [Candidatus Kerfeldbacteria bacterium]
MLLLAHIVAGSSIGVLAKNGGEAFALGMISHFVMDTLPHWNYILRVPITLKKIVAYSPDVLTPLIVFWCFVTAFPEQSGIITLATLGAVFPDIISMIALVSKTLRATVVIRVFQKFHSSIQWEIGILPGMTVQVFATAAILLATRVWYP